MENEKKKSEAARLLGSLSAKAATPKQRKARARKGGIAAQALLSHEERSRRAKVGWEKRRKAKREKGEG